MIAVKREKSMLGDAIMKIKKSAVSAKFRYYK
jgi:hypothetical protein